MRYKVTSRRAPYKQAYIKPLSHRSAYHCVGWHVVVCYGGPEWFRQKCLYRLATARLRNINTWRQLHLCVCATTAKPPRGITKGLLGLGGVAKGVLPSHYELSLNSLVAFY